MEEEKPVRDREGQMWAVCLLLWTGSRRVRKGTTGQWGGRGSCSR